MNRTMFAVTFALLLPAGLFAQEGKQDEKKPEVMKEAAAVPAPKEVSLHGYIVDAMCAKGMAKKENVMEVAAKHTRKCALEEACAESGYGVFSEGTWYKFDEKGDVMAKELIQNTKTEKGLMVMVSGTMEGDKLALATLTEHKMERGKKMEKKAEKKMAKPDDAAHDGHKD